MHNLDFFSQIMWDILGSIKTISAFPTGLFLAIMNYFVSSVKYFCQHAIYVDKIRDHTCSILGDFVLSALGVLISH